MKNAKILLTFLPNLIYGQIDLIPPVDTSMIFLPNIVSSTNLEHSSPSINIDNNLICWSMWERPKPENPKQKIMILNFKSDSVQLTIEFSEKYSDGGPIWINPNKMLFYSKRPIDKSKPDELINDLWICEKDNNSWNEPYCLNFSEHTRFAFTPSISNSGTIYFVGYADSVENNMGIYFSKLRDSGYEKPKPLPTRINSKFFDWTPFIATNESYLIFSSNRPGSKDKYGDLFISFRDKNDNWIEPISLGDKVNTDKQERFPSVSQDLGILFFTRPTDSNYDDIYWIDSRIIDEIKSLWLKQNRYFGETPPKVIPKIFAKGIISNDSYFDFAGTFSPDFKEYYFSRRGKEFTKNRIFVSKFQNGSWTIPELADFSSDIMDFEPFITPDGKHLYYGSKKEIYNKIPERSKIWYLTKNDTNWTDLKLIEPPFDSLFVMYVSFSNEKNMFFTGIQDGRQYIFESKYVNGKYEQPQKMTDSINIDGWIAHPYISPAGDYLIFDAKNRDDCTGSTDLYISFKDKNGKWMKAVNMGDKINTEEGEMCASVSPDGKYLFFCRYTDMKNGDIYWVNSSIITKLRENIQ